MADPTGTNTALNPVTGGGIGTTTLTADGIVYGNGTSAVGVLAPGTNGQLLQTQGAGVAPQWIGGMVLLNTLTPSNISAVSDTSSLTSTYRNYMVTFENLTPVTNSAILQLMVATSGASTFVSGGYVAEVATVVGGTGQANNSYTTAMALSGTLTTATVGNSTTYGLNGFVYIYNPASTTFRKIMSGSTVYLNGTTSGTANISQCDSAGYQDGGNAAITGLQFLYSNGSTATGTIRIYGMF